MKKKKAPEWTRLDNAAKIFPPNSKKSDTKVFRLSCELKEQVDKAALQEALDITMEAFPFYNSVIKSGLFWYYLEKSRIKPLVFEENIPPCSALYDKNNKTLLFRVMYYKKRIILEIYHALTDGAGALQFLRTLVLNYILIKYKHNFDNVPTLDYDASRTQKSDDSFQRYCSNSKIPVSLKRTKAYRLRGQKLPEHRISIIEGTMPLDIVLSKSKEKNASLTVYLAAVLISSINKEIPLMYKKKPVVLSIPVNLRNYYYSVTARNFFGVMNVGYDFYKNSSDLNDIIDFLKKNFEKNLTPKCLKYRLNKLTSLENNYFLRSIPLILKDIFLKIANSIVDKSYTSTLSNVGRINVPDEIKQYISSFDVFVSTNKLQACVCSYENKLRISFTSAFVNTEIQRHFFRMLSENGIPVEVASNKLDYD